MFHERLRLGSSEEMFFVKLALTERMGRLPFKELSSKPVLLDESILLPGRLLSQ